MCRRNVSTIVVVAMLALAIGQVQAESINVPNGSFELIYKPGETTITADLGGGWTNGVGPDSKMNGDQTASYSDGTTGGFVDVPGWINAPDWPIAYTWDKGSGSIAGQTTPPDGEYYFTGNGGQWGVPGGGCAESDAPLVYNIDGTYRITALYNSGVTPVAFDLLAGDVVITPSSSVDPPDPYSWDEFSRTYDIATLAPHVGEPLRIRAGWGPDTINNQGHLDVVTLEVFNRLYPSPEYGERVLVDENLELSWTNLPSDSNDVWVDVWFGTEPNALSDNYDMTKVVDATTDGKNTEAVLVDASAPDTYYWQINSYLNGADKINDSNMIEGFVLPFYAVDDIAPTVEIVTLAHMTWSGEGVPLDATVTDDAVSALTIEWSADDDSLADPDLTIEIINAGQEDATVTITKIVPTGDAVTVTVTVAVSDEANPTPDTASIEIDVYDDACHLARVGEGKSAVTDFNANCITGLEDLAVIAAAWFDDYAATGPVDR